jgi:hypothetical protein
MRSSVVLSVVMTVLSGLNSAFGQVSWSDTFPGGVPQQTWATGAQGITPQLAFFPGYAQLGATGAGAGAAYGFVPGTTFSMSTGVTVRATINPTQTAQVVSNGLLAATNLAFGSAYTATITMGGSGRLQIQRNNFGSATTVADSETAIPTFDPLGTFILEMEVAPNSSLVTARAFDSSGSTLLSQVSYADPSPLTSSAYTAGIIMQANPATPSPTIGGSFANVSAVGVPEPSSALLAVGGMALAGLAGWKRERTARQRRNEES